MRKWESRKGHGVKVVGGKKNSLLVTCLVRDLRELDCLVNFNRLALSARAVGSQCLLLYEVDFLVSSWVEGVGILGVYGDLC